MNNDTQVTFWVGRRIFLSTGVWYDENGGLGTSGYWKWDTKHQDIVALDSEGKHYGTFGEEYTKAYVAALAASVVNV